MITIDVSPLDIYFICKPYLACPFEKGIEYKWKAVFIIDIVVFFSNVHLFIIYVRHVITKCVFFLT